MPFFSVLMPTRNRASLLRSSLETAAQQRFEDYEIVVSDNNSIDDTKAVTEGFMKSSDKVKYINPGRDLSMCDSWEYALQHAAGDYITYLSDDDGLILEALPYIKALLSKFPIEVLVWPCAYYHHQDVPEPEKQATLNCDITSGNLFEVPSELIIEGLSSFDRMHVVIPKGLNCIFARSVLDKPLKKTGRFFSPPFPDYSAAYHMLGTLDSYHFIDVPLYISGTSVQSNTGMRYARKEKYEDYLSLFDRDLLAGCPYQMRYLITSYLLPTFLMFQRIYPEKMGAYRPNIDVFLKESFAELVIYEDYEDISEELEQLASYMRKHFGGDETFEALWKNHLASRDPQRKSDHLGRFAREARNFLRRNETLYRVAKKAKDLIAPASPTYFEFQGVPSMFDASKLLTDALRPIMKAPSEVTLTRAISRDFLTNQTAQRQAAAI